MNFTRTLIGTLAALTFATSGGCIIFIGDDDGEVVFDYVLVQEDGNGVGDGFAADCDVADVGAVNFLVGDDLNNDQILDDNEILEFASFACNSFDVDGNDAIDIAAEIGLYGPVLFSADFFELFAIEVFDQNNNIVEWQTFDNDINATRFSFAGGLDITANVVNDIQFDGNNIFGEGELEIFLGF